MKKSIFYLVLFLSLLVIPNLTLAETDGSTADELTTTTANAEEPAQGIGWVTEVEGRTKIVSRADEEPKRLTVGMEVFLDDEVSTSTNGRVMIELNDGSVVTLAPLSRIRITSFIYNEETKKNKSYLKLFAGSVRGLLRNLFGSSSEMSFETKTSVAGVKGSDISVWLEGDETVVAVNEGMGFIKSRDKKFPGSARIKAGFMARGKGGVAVKRAFAISDETKVKINKLKVKRKKSLVNKFKKKKAKELKKKHIDTEKNIEKKSKKKIKKIKKRIKSGNKPNFNR